MSSRLHFINTAEFRRSWGWVFCQWGSGWEWSVGHSGGLSISIPWILGPHGWNAPDFAPECKSLDAPEYLYAPDHSSTAFSPWEYQKLSDGPAPDNMRSYYTCCIENSCLYIVVALVYQLIHIHERKIEWLKRRCHGARIEIKLDLDIYTTYIHSSSNRFRVLIEILLVRGDTVRWQKVSDLGSLHKRWNPWSRVWKGLWRPDSGCYCGSLRVFRVLIAHT